PSAFLMIGNSLKSDILPLIDIGAKAIHVPFHTTWQHEKVTVEETNGKDYQVVNSLKDILKHLER
ncbi:MAG: HAD family hydrolase, partial [Bacteroidota bacterium]